MLLGFSSVETMAFDTTLADGKEVREEEDGEDYTQDDGDDYDDDPFLGQGQGED